MGKNESGQITAASPLLATTLRQALECPHGGSEQPDTYLVFAASGDSPLDGPQKSSLVMQ